MVVSSKCESSYEACPGYDDFSAEHIQAEEVAVALTYNGLSHLVMMASPNHLDDFAVGFSLSEGLIRSPDSLRGVEEEAGESGSVILHISISPQDFHQLKSMRRYLQGRSGCGLCGSNEKKNRRITFRG